MAVRLTMAWNPAIPATNADLLSAPVRDNFSARDTALMAALATLANGQVLTKAAGPVLAGVPTSTDGHVLTLSGGAPTRGGPSGARDLSAGGASGTPPRLAAVATGTVLASAGVGTAPTWSASPAVTDLKLSGGVIGTSGVGVLAIGPSTAPTTSPVDTVQFYTQDFLGGAGSRSWVIRDERGGTAGIGSAAATGPTIRLTNPNGHYTHLAATSAGTVLFLNSLPAGRGQEE